MFSPIEHHASKTTGFRPVAVAAPKLTRETRPVPSVAEAYELRLLAEVARWDDESAFAEIYAHHYAAVIAAAGELCDDADAVQDIAQQTFTALWVRASRLVAKGIRVRPWLVTVARDVAIAYVAEGRHLSFRAAAGSLEHEPSAETSVIAAETNARLAEIIATLPAEQRSALELVYIDGLTFRAAAAASDVSTTTMRVRIRAGRAALQAQLRTDSPARSR